MEMKDKLNEIINPEKIKSVLDEAGLKVIFNSRFLIDFINLLQCSIVWLWIIVR